MDRVRNFFHKKRRLFSSLSFVCGIALLTIITLASCAGITKPCVNCQRDIASDPFDKAEEVRWNDMGESSYEKSEKKKHSPRTDL